MDIIGLERKLAALLQIHQDLRQQNQQLIQAQAQWQAEKEKLVAQNQAARSKVQEMIEHLQVLERNSGQ